MGWSWILVTVIGVALLIGATIYGWVRNKGASRNNEIEAERGARELRQEMEEEGK